MKLIRRAFLTGLIGLGLVTAAPAQAANDPLTVFAAASLKNVLDEAGAAYSQGGAPKVRFSYAASSAIARQIDSGAPADIFISADSDWMNFVDGKGLIRPGTRKDLLTNRLALIAPKDSKLQIAIKPGMKLAEALGGGRLAMAGPEVPAGKYGIASLTALGVWPSVKDRVAPADNVRGALKFVSLGEAPLGIVYDTDAKVDSSVRIVGLFPENTHPRIVYPGAILKGSTNPEAARFMAFLQSAKGRTIFQKYGFTVLR